MDLPGAAHAAEHASIGLLPLFAACDRWDVGGVSADLHPATGQLTVFVYDGHDEDALFAERGYGAAREWLRATADAIRGCECQAGCPSCIQSPKCGNGNEPLSKPGSVTLLEGLLAGGEGAGGGYRTAWDIGKIGQDQEEYAGSAQKGGDPRRGGERGSPNGPAPGGQSRARTQQSLRVSGPSYPIGHDHADNEKVLSVISSLAVSSSAEAGPQEAAAFFDLDKTIIAKSSTLAYGPSFYRNGLISRGDAVRSAVAQLLFTRRGASHDRMEQIRLQVGQLCRGWPAEQVREIVARHLDELIVPYVYDEARALVNAHRAAGEDVIIVSTSGHEMVSPIGALLGAVLVIAARWRSRKAASPVRWSSTPTAPPKRSGSGSWPGNVVTGWPTVPPTATRSPTCPCWRRWATRTR